MQILRETKLEGLKLAKKIGRKKVLEILSGKRFSLPLSAL